MIAILIVVLILCIGASRHALRRYEDSIRKGLREASPSGETGAEVALDFLKDCGIEDVEIVEHNGIATNYFDPSRRRLFLSREMSQGKHLSAWAVALHEAAHASQTGDALGELKWRQSCIRMTRYVPTFVGIALIVMSLLKVLPFRMALMAFGAVCTVLLLLNLGSMAIEYNANLRLRRYLERKLASRPSAEDKLDHLLSVTATRELGDLLRSPKFFFFSALPGAGKIRPR